MTGDHKTLTILLAEDDIDDQLLVKRVLGQFERVRTISTVQNGVELLDYLNRQGEYTDPDRFPFPDLIFLDLNMPLMDGREALRTLKADALLRQIPVIVLTTSSADIDVNSTYDMGVSAYITKPINYRDLERALGTAIDFWCDVVTLPGPVSFR